MELQLKNIGMIKETNVKIDGLTVIAGENDTGKSTVGKALYLVIKSRNKNFIFQKKTEYSLEDLMKVKIRTNMIHLFKSSAITPPGSFISLDNNTILHKNYSEGYINWEYQGEVSLSSQDIVFVESPLVWNFTDFFRDIAQIESQIDVRLDYPYLMKELNFKLHIKSASDGLDIKEKVTTLMGGEFKKDEMGRYYFDKNGQRIELVNTATGIKQFGIFQVLSQNNYFNKDTILVLDEPEVHLHPKWQLEMAKIIVELVEYGVKVVVNSHSPYMVDALKYYSDLSKINNHFYLAEQNQDGTSIIRNVTMDLSSIFEKLTEPLERLHKMKLGLINED